jgi:hypothetical protein
VNPFKKEQKMASKKAIKLCSNFATMRMEKKMRNILHGFKV